MLVLSRQRDETIMIGDDIEVTVVDIRGDKVRLGINAPKEISVHRKEVYDAIRRENRAAAQVKPEDLSGLGKITPTPGAGGVGGGCGWGLAAPAPPGLPSPDRSSGFTWAAARFSRRIASYTSLRCTLISFGAVMPRRTLSPRMSTTVTSMSSPIMIVSSL